MWHNMMDFNVAPLNLILRAVAVYFAIVILLRISGKRELGQMSATDLVALLLISNAVQNSMNGGDNSLVGGLLLAAVLVALSLAMSHLTFRSRFFRMALEGTPTLLIHDGKIIQKHLVKERMNESELRVLLREQGIHELNEIQAAILEADGKLSVIKSSDISSK